MPQCTPKLSEILKLMGSRQWNLLLKSLYDERQVRQFIFLHVSIWEIFFVQFLAS